VGDTLLHRKKNNHFVKTFSGFVRSSFLKRGAQLYSRRADESEKSWEKFEILCYWREEKKA
jgi:hypothetical protein